MVLGQGVLNNAKACEELGIDGQTTHAYHKSHVNKMWGTAITVFFPKTILRMVGRQ